MRVSTPFSFSWKGKVLFYSLSLLLVLGTCALFPLEFTRTAEQADNPQHCPYYISLQSILATYPLLANDKANIVFIKNKILKFENKLQKKTPAHKDIFEAYLRPYLAQLASYHVTSIKQVETEENILTIAKNSYPFIDAYYLNTRFFCLNPLYHWDPLSSRRILRYNLNGLYDRIPSPYSRIISAVSEVWLTGSSPGFFINNQTTTMDTRFLTGMPLLTALYVLPKFDFVKVGGYFPTMPWSYFNAHSFIDPITRKIINVGGIDVFTVEKSQLPSLPIPGIKPLASNSLSIFSSTLRSFINTQSYGIAYFAHHLSYISPSLVTAYENEIKHYFSTHQDVRPFLNATQALYSRLLQLKDKHDVILESTPPSLSIQTKSSLQTTNSQFKIEGIVGERALFTTLCAEKTCTFVFNIAYAPSWHAYVNGKPSPITRTNFAFLSTTVPEGKATVWFIYASLIRTLSEGVSLLFLAWLIVSQCRHS